MPAQIVDRGRGPEIAGTRITVYHVLDYLQAGWHHTAIAAQLRLCTDEVLAAIRYIEEHRDEVMSVYQQIVERAAAGNPPEIKARLKGSRAKLRDALKRIQEQKEEEHRIYQPPRPPNPPDRTGDVDSGLPPCFVRGAW